MTGNSMTVAYAGGATGACAAVRSGAAIVVVDAFRTSAKISVLVSKGARVVPVSSIGEAASATADFRIGDRGSMKVAGFDFGNSPTKIFDANIPSGSTVILSTTNGTRVIEAAAGAHFIFTGSFVNATALADVIHDEGIKPVTVIGCGWEGHRSSEDEAAAGAILHRLEERGARLDSRARRVVDSYFLHSVERLRGNSAAWRLKSLGYERDLTFCLAEDTVPVAPRLVDGAFIEG